VSAIAAIREELLAGTSQGPRNKRAVWAGYVLSALPVVMMLFSASLKLAHADAVVDKWGVKFGYPIAGLIPIGLLELACAVVYVIPRTAVLGAILVSCYLAAAFAAHIRIEDAGGGLIPLFLGVCAWGGLYLRDARIRALLPVRR
jgi:DoxX-like family